MVGVGEGVAETSGKGLGIDAVPPKILIPKKFCTSSITAQAEATITSPTIALVILLRAASMPALSPPEVIHWIPPKIRKRNVKTAAMIKSAAATEPMSCPTSFIFTIEGWGIKMPVGVGLGVGVGETVWAKTAVVKVNPKRLRPASTIKTRFIAIKFLKLLYYSSSSLLVCAKKYRASARYFICISIFRNFLIW